MKNGATVATVVQTKFFNTFIMYVIYASKFFYFSASQPISQLDILLPAIMVLIILIIPTPSNDDTRDHGIVRPSAGCW